VAKDVRDLFPNSTIITVFRDPRDNIRSLLSSRKLPGDRLHLPWYYRLRMLLERRELHRLFPGDSSHEQSYVAKLAQRWNYAFQCTQNLPGPCLMIRYEDFVENKLSFLHQLACSAKLSALPDPKLELNRPFQPPSDRSKTWNQSSAPVIFRRSPKYAEIESKTSDTVRRVSSA